MLGSGVGVLACGLVISLADSHADELGMPMVVPVGSSVATLGALLGHLRGGRSGGSTPRLANLRGRELADYLTPGERRLVRLAVVVPLLAVALGFVIATQAGGRAVTGSVFVTLSLVSLLVGLLAGPLGRRSLTAPSDVTTAGGLVWAAVLRGVLLRDVVSGLWVTATMASGMIPIAAWMAGDQSAAADVLGVLVLGSAVAVNIGFAWVSFRDTNHRWAREHAAPGAPT